jgi:hypothetical protein
MTISYKKTFAPDGTVYTQTIKLNKSEFLSIGELLHHEKEHAKEPQDKIYLKDLNDTPTEKTKKGLLYFLNLTQLKHILKYEKNKRILKNRNTILYLQTNN